MMMMKNLTIQKFVLFKSSSKHSLPFSLRTLRAAQAEKQPFKRRSREKENRVQCSGKAERAGCTSLV